MAGHEALPMAIGNHWLRNVSPVHSTDLLRVLYSVAFLATWR